MKSSRFLCVFAYAWNSVRDLNARDKLYRDVHYVGNKTYSLPANYVRLDNPAYQLCWNNINGQKYHRCFLIGISTFSNVQEVRPEYLCRLHIISQPYQCNTRYGRKWITNSVSQSKSRVWITRLCDWLARLIIHFEGSVRNPYKPSPVFYVTTAAQQQQLRD